MNENGFRMQTMRDWMCAAIVIALGFSTAGCNSNYAKSEAEEKPLLKVVQAPYKFCLYPKFVTEEESLLSLSIQKENNFIENAEASAKLIPQEGNEVTAKFHFDKASQSFAAEVPLRHHQNYVIETKIEIADAKNKTFSPVFSFHCGDPVFDTMDLKAVQTKEDSQEKLEQH